MKFLNVSYIFSTIGVEILWRVSVYVYTYIYIYISHRSVEASWVQVALRHVTRSIARMNEFVEFVKQVRVFILLFLLPHRPPPRHVAEILSIPNYYLSDATYRCTLYV